MRLAVCAFSAVLLSGCSWLGFDNSSYYGNSRTAQNSGRYTAQGQQHQKKQHQQRHTQKGHCQITSPSQRIPQGCRPEQVTLATGGQSAGYAQQGQYTSGGYGSHAENTYGSTRSQVTERQRRKPKLRGSFGLEIDRSFQGDLYDTANSAVTAYNRAAYQEGTVSGVVVGGDLVQTLYTSDAERIIAPDISYDDAYSAPLRVNGGLEYIFNDKTTVFANAGYTWAEGKKGGSAQIVDSLRQTVTTSTFDDAGVLVNSITNSSVIPNQVVAQYDFVFNDMERVDLELGTRHYFNPFMPTERGRTVTPFVSASAGMAHYNETTVAENQRQLFLKKSYDSGAIDNDFYDVNFGTETQVYDAQWVPYGSLKAGMEWQVTPKTALAFEAGLKYEGARDFSGGVKGDDNLSVPVAIRGSYNF